jgi:hypothetical protein
MRTLAALIVLFLAAPAGAQPTSVGATLVGDIARFTRVEQDEEAPRGIVRADRSIDGEGLGFTVALLRAIGERWGVALEFTRGGEIERRTSTRLSPIQPLPPVPVPFPIPLIEVDVRIEQQHLSLAALGWVRQRAGARVELTYLGGVSFNRSEFERDLRLSVSRPVIIVPIDPATDVIEYRVGPAIGADAAFRVANRVFVVGGARLHAVTVAGRGGWLFRPAVGAQWRFE